VGCSVSSGRSRTSAVAAGRHSHRGRRATISARGRSSQREDDQKAMPPRKASGGAWGSLHDGIEIDATAVAVGPPMQAAQRGPGVRHVLRQPPKPALVSRSYCELPG